MRHTAQRTGRKQGAREGKQRHARGQREQGRGQVRTGQVKRRVLPGLFESMRVARTP